MKYTARIGICMMLVIVLICLVVPMNIATENRSGEISIYGVDITSFDSDYDGFNDSLQLKIDVDTIYSSALIDISASLLDVIDDYWDWDYTWYTIENFD